jgi:hypothetical protein
MVSSNVCVPCPGLGTFLLIAFPLIRSYLKGLTRSKQSSFSTVIRSFVQYKAIPMWAGIAQSVHGLVTGWTHRGSNPGGRVIFRIRPECPWGLLYCEYRVFFQG